MSPLMPCALDLSNNTTAERLDSALNKPDDDLRGDDVDMSGLLGVLVPNAALLLVSAPLDLTCRYSKLDTFDPCLYGDSNGVGRDTPPPRPPCRPSTEPDTCVYDAIRALPDRLPTLFWVSYERV